MEKIRYADIPQILESIYDSEIACRIEFMFDAGYTWSIIGGGNYPRLWIDDNLQGGEIIAETTENMLLRNNPLLEKDWVARGCKYSFGEAIKELADKICELYPDCKLAKWY